MSSALVDERFSLRVRNLPAVLSTEAITSLLSHYGAICVRVLKRRNATSSGKEPGLPPPLPPTAVPPQHPRYAPAPLAPHLGLNYAPSPLLEYKYPKASESIVRNIANALIALPRFYTQVLHLMNKMNLPPPFEEDAIPGSFSVKQDTTHTTGGFQTKHLKRRRIDDELTTQLVEEDEDDDQDEDNVKMSEAHSPPRSQQPSEASGASVLGKPLKQENYSLPALIGRPLARQTKALSIKKDASFNTAFQTGTDDSSCLEVQRSTRPGVISAIEVNRQRLTPEELVKEPFLESYVRGLPSSSIIVKNIAHGVDEKDLRYVFSYVLPMDMALDSMKVTLLPAKDSAVIDYLNEEVATAAVNELHGVRLEGKTLIVSFHNTSEDTEIATVARWTVKELASKRVLETQLASEKAMKKYQRGQPSNSLYVKNLAKTVELVDLFAVFGAVLPPESGLEALNIRHFTEGRMKCQAFVTYPSVDLASSALLHVHGVILKDKPLIVCFRNPPKDSK
ncbi:RNA recognition motif-containing protein [Phytophthora infestans]|uniref:RNA recognition motif-containing protein n=1 Tax=Phytophthora infestans TaxID=4787 RepID=A0A8S9V3X3_PHYIN|nr:RNA recognition motif-containing protein [Phytophthora infestans]